MKTKDGHEPRLIDSPEKMAAWLHEAIDGALADKSCKGVHKERYGNVPQVTLTDEERGEIRAIGEELNFYLRCLSDLRDYERDVVLRLMATCFKIGQKTQYSEALIRSFEERVTDGLSAAWGERSKPRIIIEKALEVVGHKTKRHLTSGAVAGMIEGTVNAELVRTGVKKADDLPLQRESIRKTIDRIWAVHSDGSPLV